MANTVNIIDRRIKLEGIHNIRDLGGLRTEDGAVIRRNCLLRSGQLGKATPADREYLRTKHRLSAVIDLPTPRERDQMPEGDLQGIELLEIPVFEDIRTGLSHESSADAQMTTEEFLGSMPSLSVMYVNIGRQELCKETSQTELTRYILRNVLLIARKHYKALNAGILKALNSFFRIFLDLVVDYDMT